MGTSSISIDLNQLDSICIGRKSNNDIIIKDKNISGIHCKLFKNGTDWFVEDLNSTNGTFVDDSRIDTTTVLANGSTLKLMDYSFVLEDDILNVYGNTDVITYSKTYEEPTGRTEKHDINQEVNKMVEEKSEEPSAELPRRKKTPQAAPYPYFYPSPRLIDRVPTGEINIDPAPDTAQKPSMNWISIVISSAVMMGMMALIGIVAGGILFNPLYMLPMMMMSVVTGFINYSSQKKRFKNEQKLLVENYSKYLEDKEAEIQEAISVQRKIEKKENPDNYTLLDVARNHGVTMWNRTMRDEDAVSIRVGTTSEPFAKSIKAPKVGFTLYDKQFQRDPQALAEKYTEVDEVPLLHNFRMFPTLGIVGDYNQTSSLARSIIIQAAMHYGYDDLKIVIVYPKTFSQDWEIFRWLPHLRDYSGDVRYIASDSRESSDFVGVLLDEIKDRQPKEAYSSYGEQSIPSPFYLFIVLAPGLLENALLNYMFSNDYHYGCGTVFLSQTIYDLPPATSTVIEARGGESRYYEKNRANIVRSFRQDVMDVDMAEKFARTLAPVRTEGTSAEQSLPTYITFLQGYGIKKPDELDLGDYWENSRPEQTMAVPIGIRSNGSKFNFDINEKAHGPHGLVAGTTGSGKSEMIQSWILSMAIQFSPQDVSFVLIDFKGTGLILPFLNLPHLAGTISDLDVSIDRNLVALEAELQRRKALFDEAGVSNISSYLELYHKGIVEEPLSYLFVIIDEYAEFKAIFPDFTAGVNSLFRTGRTLGVHIILLTQNPSGIISDQSESNVSFRWCLKVASTSASKEILGGHPDAAKLTNPGRAFIRVGTDEIFEPIQSFYSGAKFTTDMRRRSVEREEHKMIVNHVALNGKRTELVADNSDKGKKLTKGTEIEAVVNYIQEYTKKKGIPAARPIWSKKLPDIIYLYDVLKADDTKKDGVIAPIVGMLDDPATQTQFSFRLPLSENGHAVIFGAPGTGKSTFLQTLILSLCLDYTPEEVNLYLLDFGSWTMGMFKDFPHVGSVANDNEEEKVNKTAQLLESILDERKMTFSRMGIGSVQAYNYSAKEKLPYIFLIIDNFTSVLQLYPKMEDFFLRLTKEGGNYGVLLIATVGTAGGLGYKLQQNIKNNVALQMTDTADYASIVGRTGGLYPENITGRGLYKTDRILEFQTALPGEIADENERGIRIREEGTRQRANYTGKYPKLLPIMPDVVNYGSVHAEADLTFGLVFDKLEPIGMRLSDSHTLLISGTPESGKTNLCKVIAKELTDKCSGAEISVVGKEHEYENTGVRIINDDNSLTEYLVSLSEVLKERKAKKDSGEMSNDSLICLIIEDIDQRITNWDDSIVNRLNAIAQMGRGLNVVLIMAGDNEGLKKMKGSYAVINMMSGAYHIMIGGKPSDHDILRMHLATDQTGRTLREYEGFFTDEHTTVPFRAMYEK